MNRHLLFILRFCAMAALLLFPATAGAKIVNLFAGAELGGYGDVASNLYMIQSLRRMYPEWKLNVFVGKKEAQLLNTLLPAFDPRKNRQNIGGIEFFSGPGAILPRADVFIGFSITRHPYSPVQGYAKDFYVKEHYQQTNIYDDLRKISNAPVALYFKEFGDAEHDLDLVTSSKDGTIFHFDSGIGAAGLYVSPETHEQDPEKELLAREFRLIKHDIASLVNRNVKIGFGYSAKVFPLWNYLRAAGRLASKNPGERYLIFIKDFGESEQLPPELPANVILVRLGATPFELTRAIIRAADIPILVTGDVSLSLAIDYEKPFLYEALRWKKKSVSLLLEKTSASEELAQALTLPALAPDEQLWKPTAALEAALDKMFQSAEFQAQVKKRLSRLKKQSSLPAFVARTFQALDEMPQHNLELGKAKSSAIVAYLEEKGFRRAPTLKEKLLKGCSDMLTKVRGVFSSGQ